MMKGLSISPMTKRCDSGTAQPREEQAKGVSHECVQILDERE